MLRGDFVLASGQRSAYYIDARRVTLSSEGAPLVARAFLKAMDDLSVEAVGGLTLGADPIISSIVTVAGMSGRSVDGLIVRKAAKEHGAARRIEGPLRQGMSVVVVEDTSTTGASALEAVDALRWEGAEVRAVISLIDRDQGARDLISRADLEYRSIFKAAEIVAVEDHPTE